MRCSTTSRGWRHRDEGGDEDQLDRLARRADQLPLLQFALNRMWVAAAARAGEGPVVIELADYEALGGLKGALNNSAEKILEDLGERRRKLVQAVFTALTAGTAIADAASNPLHYQELVAICGAEEREVRAVVNAFRARGCDFLLPGLGADDAGEETPIEPDTRIEITHESLIRQWRGLSSWLEREGRAGQRWRRLKEDADQRFETGLLGGQRLAAIKEWRRREWPNAAWAKRYGDDYEKVTKFVDASLDAESTQKLRRNALVAVAAAVIVVAGFWGWRQRVHAVAVATADKVDSGYRRAAETFAYGLPGKMEPLINGDSDMSGRASPQAIQQLAIAQAQLLDAMWNINQHDNVFLTAEIQTLRFSLPLIAEKDNKASAGRASYARDRRLQGKAAEGPGTWTSPSSLSTRSPRTTTSIPTSGRTRSRRRAKRSRTRRRSIPRARGRTSRSTSRATGIGGRVRITSGIWTCWASTRTGWARRLRPSGKEPDQRHVAARQRGCLPGALRGPSQRPCPGADASRPAEGISASERRRRRRDRGIPERARVRCGEAEGRRDSELNRQWVANRATWLAQAEQDAGLFAQAKKDFEQALNVRMQVATMDASDPQATRDVASSLRSLEDLVMVEGDPAGAVLYLNECKQQIETLGARSPDSEFAPTTSRRSGSASVDWALRSGAWGGTRMETRRWPMRRRRSGPRSTT